VREESRERAERGACADTGESARATRAAGPRWGGRAGCAGIRDCVGAVGRASQRGGAEGETARRGARAARRAHREEHERAARRVVDHPLLRSPAGFGATRLLPGLRTQLPNLVCGRVCDPLACSGQQVAEAMQTSSHARTSPRTQPLLPPVALCVAPSPPLPPHPASSVPPCLLQQQLHLESRLGGAFLISRRVVGRTGDLNGYTHLAWVWKFQTGYVPGGA